MNQNSIKTHLDALAEIAKQWAGNSDDMASIKVNCDGYVIMGRGVMEDYFLTTEEAAVILAKAVS